MYYFGARYYDPRTSVWQSVDPILGQYLDGTPNSGVYNSLNLALTGYGGLNPVRFNDPTGLFNEDTGEIEKGDTLNAIRNQLNAKYNTDLSTSDIANRNNINNPDKIYPGQNIKPPVLQDRANALAGEVSKRGKFLGKGEADWLYQINSDRNLGVTVDASQLTFKRDGNWVRDPKGGKKASGHVTGDEYWIHGQGTVRHRPNETYGLYDGSYDFEMHSVRGLKDIVRNIGTIIGAPPAGFPNTPYSIHYKGNVNVKNP